MLSTTRLWPPKVDPINPGSADAPSPINQDGTPANYPFVLTFSLADNDGKVTLKEKRLPAGFSNFIRA